jgi:hypothetical protein
MIWENWAIYPWPLGAIDWDLFVWDDTSISGSTSDCGNVFGMFYVYEGANHKTSGPYHSSAIVTTTAGQNVCDVVNWRATSFPSDTYLCQVEAISGDTSKLLLWEYGQSSNVFDFGDWVDAYRLQIGLYRWGDTGAAEYEGAGTNTATFRVRFCQDDGTGSFGDRKPLAGTESVWKTITITCISSGDCP